MTRTGGVRRVIWRVAIGFGLLYTISHFAISGVFAPLRFPNLGQVLEEIRPVQAYHEHGRPVEITNRRQYGPTFFFVSDAVLRLCRHDLSRLDEWFYGIQLAAFGLAFLLTFLSLQIWLRNRASGPPGSGPRTAVSMGGLLLLLGFLWLNFSPVYYIIAVKNVEMWELCLLAAGLYCTLRHWRLPAGLCVAAAVLTKMLPLIFLFLFLIRDRRLFLSCCAGLVVILAVSHWLYGPQMGFGYLPFMLKAAIGNTHGLTYHENVSFKGMLVKWFAGWHLDPETYNTIISADKLVLANVLGHLMQFGGLVWMGWIFAQPSSRESPRWQQDRVLWEWSLVSAMMMVLSPVMAFEYSALTLIAFSFLLAALVADAAVRTNRRLVAYVGVSVFLVANVLPRGVINHLVLIGQLNRVSGHAFLTLSEGYQYYGFPLLGVLALITALWLLRQQLGIRRNLEPPAQGGAASCMP